MTTRFNVKSKTTYGTPGIQSGYDIKSSSDLSIPSVGVEDVDKALFDLFNKELQLAVSTSNNNRSELQKVPIIFAAAEKWALSKRQKALRDSNGSLILPIITIIRTSVEQNLQEDICGRGINQQTGEIVIKRRLDDSDKDYQRLINKQFITSQDGTVGASSGNLSSTRQTLGLLKDDQAILDGGLLATNIKNNNIIETITIPAPQFFTATFDVTIWTQYNTQMIQILETIMSSFLPQGNSWKLETAKGYWFIAYVDGNSYLAENNSEDMSSEERIIKHKFTIKVPAYILAAKIPGAPIPIKKYVSSPEISFSLQDENLSELESDSVVDPFLGSDDPTLPITNSQTYRNDQRDTGHGLLYPGKQNLSENDLALKSFKRAQSPAKYKKISYIKNGKTYEKFIRIINKNKATGETVYSAEDLNLGTVNFLIK